MPAGTAAMSQRASAMRAARAPPHGRLSAGRSPTSAACRCAASMQVQALIAQNDHMPTTAVSVHVVSSSGGVDELNEACTALLAAAQRTIAQAAVKAMSLPEPVEVSVSSAKSEQLPTDEEWAQLFGAL